MNEIRVSNLFLTIVTKWFVSWICVSRYIFQSSNFNLDFKNLVGNPLCCCWMLDADFDTWYIYSRNQVKFNDTSFTKNHYLSFLGCIGSQRNIHIYNIYYNTYSRKTLQSGSCATAETVWQMQTITTSSWLRNKTTSLVDFSSINLCSLFYTFKCLSVTSWINGIYPVLFQVSVEVLVQSSHQTRWRQKHNGWNLLKNGGAKWISRSSYC